ncbi:MAG: hypothetical protein NZ872_05745 [Archaeoglobaceae archaeon]|nr:hypothetical protein [Archaeoglobaceae archaeon]MDW8128701.1 hypothetical protein [Archaeoglobaceae archaeon]
MNDEPFVLFTSKKFLDKASKVFGLGFLTRKPALEIFKKLGIPIVELNREQAKNAIERVGETKGMNISMAQLIKGLALAFFLPTGVFLATLKKVHYRSGFETTEFIFVELLAEIPRAFRTTLFYDLWLIVPKIEKGGEKARELIKGIVERVGEKPLSEEDWENLKPIRDKLSGKLELNGLYENLWKKF